MKNISKYYIWLTGMKKAWEEKNFTVLSDILAEDLDYFESPFSPPITSKQKVIKQWKKDLPSQKDIVFDYQILAAWEFYCIAHWSAHFSRNNKVEYLDGIFYFKLNSENKCKFFKWWWVVK
jgi:hypothetical protein